MHMMATNRGAKIVNACENFTLMVIKKDFPTWKASSGPSSSPGITIKNSNLAIDSSWEPKTTLNSNHLPIIVNIDGRFSEPPQSGQSCYSIFRACIHSSLGPTRAFVNKKSCVTNHRNFIYPYPLIAKFTVLKPPIIS